MLEVILKFSIGLLLDQLFVHLDPVLKFVFERAIELGDA
jgi:hypothetical protein